MRSLYNKNCKVTINHINMLNHYMLIDYKLDHYMLKHEHTT